MARKLSAIALVMLAFVSQANAQDCSAVVEGNDQIQFVQSELTVSASCTEVSITLKHIGQLAANIMGHNWVLTMTSDYQAVAQAGQAAGPPNFVPDSDARIMAATPVIGGGEETTITFDISGLEAGGDYTYFCTFPGHFVLMFGKFIIE